MTRATTSQLRQRDKRAAGNFRISLSGSIQYYFKYKIVFSDVDRTLCRSFILCHPDLVLPNRET